MKEYKVMKVMRNILKLLVLIPLLSACGDDFFAPGIENIRDISPMYKEPQFAQGIMLNAYNYLPYNDWSVSDVATDDAVSNDITNAYLKMATGTWTSLIDPMTQWQNKRNAMQYLNIFLQAADSVPWASNPIAKVLFRDRLKGEAYGLRALQLFSLIQAHGGWTASGKLMGVPILRVPETTTSNYNIPRNTFKDCLDSINADITRALNLLPLDFTDISGVSSIPAKYVAIGLTNPSDYNRVFGNTTRGRLTSRILEAIRAQVALMAASPAYSAGTNTTWANAADNAAIVLDRIGGVTGLQSTGHTWYANISEINGLSSGSTSPEIIWRRDVNTTRSFETDNYPPSLFGRGRINPTQNLVDAFPAANGYPISDPLSNYVASNPYANRDPRLTTYIVVNGGVQGPAGATINTGTFNTTNNDAINKQSGASTRTGYYLRKLTRKDVNVNPASVADQKHINARIRYTEIFLAYAEAANEAWGPLGTGTHSYSAYDVIKAIRKRALALTTDPYLESIKNDQAAMRALIRNERRLELCFENIRFYDLRRWKVDLATLNQTARGMQIDKPDGVNLTFTPINVEARSYKDYMYYGPIPYSETLKYNLLEQNAGW